jgi:hypothetical protein
MVCDYSVGLHVSGGATVTHHPRPLRLALPHPGATCTYLATSTVTTAPLTHVPHHCCSSSQAVQQTMQAIKHAARSCAPALQVTPPALPVQRARHQHNAAVGLDAVRCIHPLTPPGVKSLGLGKLVSTRWHHLWPKGGGGRPASTCGQAGPGVCTVPWAVCHALCNTQTRDRTSRPV